MIAHNPGCCNYTAFNLIKSFPFGFKLNLNLKLYPERVEYLSLATAASVSQFVSFAHLLLNKCTYFPGTPLLALPGFPGQPQPSRLSSTTCSPAPAPPPRGYRRSRRLLPGHRASARRGGSPATELHGLRLGTDPVLFAFMKALSQSWAVIPDLLP